QTDLAHADQRETLMKMLVTPTSPPAIVEGMAQRDAAYAERLGDVLSPYISDYETVVPKIMAPARTCLYQVGVIGYSVYHPTSEEVKADLVSGNARSYKCQSDPWLGDGTEDEVAPNGPPNPDRYEFVTIMPGLRNGDVIEVGPEIVMRLTPEERERLRLEEEERLRKEREEQEKERLRRLEEERQRVKRDILAPLRQFLTEHHLSCLKEQNVAPLLATFTPLYTEFCGRACEQCIAGMSDEEQGLSRALRVRLDEMGTQLHFREKEEENMRQIIAELKALPVVVDERFDDVDEELAVIALRLKRADPTSRKASTLTAGRDALLAEKHAMEETTVKARSLLSSLTRRHMFHPEAKEVIDSNPLLHPLENTRLAPFAKACLSIPLHRFSPSAFEGVSRTTLLQGVHPDSRVPVVLKGYDLSDRDQVEHARREVSVFEAVQDSHVVPYLGLVLDTGMCYVVTEKYDCNLLQFLKHQNPSVETRRFIAREILLGMAALEGQRVVHRDIKPQNVLVKHHGHSVTGVVLADFGISKNKQDYVTTLQRTSSATMLFCDPESLSTLTFDSLSDIYSYGRTMQVLFCDREHLDNLLWMHGENRFSSTQVGSSECNCINHCLGPKADRISAHHMAASGLFRTCPGQKGGAVADAALARVDHLRAECWKRVHKVRSDADTVPCTAESLLRHFTPAEGQALSDAGYCRIEVSDAGGDGESPLRAMLSALQIPVLVDGHMVRLLEPAGEGEFPLIPSLAACTIMQDNDAGVDIRKTLCDYYFSFGRFLAFQLVEGSLPHGMLGLAVLAAMRGDINTLLQDKAATSRVFASTFPDQRHYLLGLLGSKLEESDPTSFDSIPGSPESDEVLTRHNTEAFATLFESCYVRLMMEAGVEIHRGFCSLHPEWAEATAALTLDQFLAASVSMAPFTADKYTAVFTIESERLRDAFKVFVESQLALHNDTLLRLVLVFATSSPMLPHSKITLELAEHADRLALPFASQCTATITVPDTCLDRLDLALQDSCDAAGISLGDGTRSRQAAVAELNQELNRFRILSDRTRTCPSCGVAVHRTGGCNHMHCHCGRHWCWECGFVSTCRGPVYTHMVSEH
ncbi:hypothetical protein KIPB_000391, partial [Kipferlia bialata]